ncbi:MAG TPA: hypothetical protein VFN21_05655 [Acidimicrobiales bacterium]|nr:hypothetical protein [Acidimicrobiales bacterium]
MNSEGEQRTSRILVFTDTEVAEGTMWRAVVHYADGSLAIQGFDTGPGVQHDHGPTEFEFARELSPAETDRLGALLGMADGDDLLVELGRRFTTTAEFEDYLKNEGVSGTFTEWRR